MEFILLGLAMWLAATTGAVVYSWKYLPEHNHIHDHPHEHEHDHDFVEHTHDEYLHDHDFSDPGHTHLGLYHPHVHAWVKFGHADDGPRGVPTQVYLCDVPDCDEKMTLEV